MSKISKVGLLAGKGDLPVEFLKSAKGKGVPVTLFALEGVTEKRAAELSEETVWIKPFRLGKFLKELERSGVEEIFILGKVEHRSALLPTGFDLKALKFLLSLPDRKPETLIGGIIEEIEKLGVKVSSPVSYLKHLLLSPGTLFGKRPDRKVEESFLYGMKVARTVASLDVGQTVVVKEGSVIAVEGIEGTDACIERGARLSGGGFIVCKAAREHQDMRIDVPTVGMETVRLIKKLGGKGLVVEAGRTFVLNRKQIEEFCSRTDFFFLAL